MSFTIKKAKILLFCLLFAKLAQAQNVNYEYYHDDVNQAEVLFLKEQYSESIDLYKRIFQQYQFVFAKDCVIAAQISLLANDSINTSFFIKRAILQGVKIDFFSKVSIFSSFVNSYSWLKIQKDYTTLRKQYFKNIDFERKRKWASRYNLEQELKHVKTLRAYKAKMLENVNAIIEECKTVGYPGEKMLGIDDAQLTKRKSDFDISADIAFISLAHHSCSYVWIEKYFKKEIQKGNIHPRQCAYLSDFLKIIRKNAESDDCDTSQYRSTFVDWTYKIDVNQVEEVNKLREKWHICSVQQEKAKEQFEAKIGVKLFFGFGMHKGYL